VEHDADALPRITQADLLGISRRSLYYQPVPPSPVEGTFHELVRRQQLVERSAP